MKLPTLYSEIIHLSRYARYIPERQVRESWEDTINRYFSFIENHFIEKTNLLKLIIMLKVIRV